MVHCGQGEKLQVNAIEEIKRRLEKYPTLRFRGDNRSITVDAPSPEGFSLSLTSSNDEYVVSFNGWHENFKSDAEALNCFAMGLSDQCRLKVVRRGKTEYKWTLEYWNRDGWCEESTTGLLVFPFWQKAEIVYRQNSIIVGEHPKK